MEKARENIAFFAEGLFSHRRIGLIATFIAGRSTGVTAHRPHHGRQKGSGSLWKAVPRRFAFHHTAHTLAPYGQLVSESNIIIANLEYNGDFLLLRIFKGAGKLVGYIADFRFFYLLL